MAPAKKTATKNAPKGNNEELDRLRKENDELKKRLSRIADLAGGPSASDEDEDDFDEEDDEDEDDELEDEEEEA